MTPTLDSTTTPSSSLVERLAQQLGASASAQTIFGTPVERNGVTVIPVARAIYGFGGGGGSKVSEGEGSGGGAGMALTPIGYIELTEGRSRFRPIRGSVVPLVAVSGLVALLLLRSVPKLLRRNR
ncbi:spore germination protein GerW family protein [Hymenobacter sediminicola]|uniref:Sporulation protein n=1 Tax=Hymenobacter sediminicola TaxID=2761579 RepID=A0A7G7W3P6_9BACT|nr:spore germination protein GerW family protein [Hymenobacter sediminicola]QNH60989.1 sporulation protein [Hymenobacter sediminicola]